MKQWEAVEQKRISSIKSFIVEVSDFQYSQLSKVGNDSNIVYDVQSAVLAASSSCGSSPSLYLCSYPHPKQRSEIYHLEEAAIGGHPWARFNLGCEEDEKGRTDRAVKHFIIAAKLGYDDALEPVKKLFSVGMVSKEDFEAALRGHQAAVDATKSEQRDAAYAFDNVSPEEQEEQIPRLLQS